MINEIFETSKPVIGMVHFPPLPGSPLYDGQSLREISEIALHDAQIYEKLGFDGILFSNEGDRPYLSNVDEYTTAVMSRLIFEITQKVRMPFGVSVLADPEAAIAVAEAVEANFVRIFLTWVFVGDWGFINPKAGELQRFKKNIFGKAKILANVSGHSEPLGGRSIGQIVKGAIKFGLADGICVSGSTAGEEAPEEDIKLAKENSDGVPVFVGTGVNIENLERMLNISDGIIVGTSLKKEGNTFNPVDEERAKKFIERAKEIKRRRNYW